MKVHPVTVLIEAESLEGARLLASAAGFTVKVTRPRIAVGITEPHPFVRPSATLDMPAGLTPDERKAYVKGYAAGCLTYVKKNGVPRADGDARTSKTVHAALVAATRQAEWDRHPAAHRKALSELAAHRDRTEAYLAARGTRLEAVA